MFKILAIGLVLITFISGGIMGLTMMDEDFGHMGGHHHVMDDDYCDEIMNEECEYENNEDCELNEEECEEEYNEYCDHHDNYFTN